jgi:hypothetical protein
MLIPWLASPDSLTAAHVPDMVFREWPPKSRTQASGVEFFGDLIITILGCQLFDQCYSRLRCF